MIEQCNDLALLRQRKTRKTGVASDEHGPEQGIESDLHSTSLPLLRERSQLLEDDANPSLSDLFGKQVCLTSAYESDLQRLLEREGLLDLGLQRYERSDDIRALRVDDEWRFALGTHP